MEGQDLSRMETWGSGGARPCSHGGDAHCQLQAQNLLRPENEQSAA